MKLRTSFFISQNEAMGKDAELLKMRNIMSTGIG
jgi:hypothetical protein